LFPHLRKSIRCFRCRSWFFNTYR